MKRSHSDLDEILSLLEGKEGENLEFKEAKSHFEFDRLARYCAALANEGGGKVVLCHVLPALPPSSIRSLLRTLKNRGQIYSVGYTNAGR